MEERLKELNGRILLSKKEYLDVCNEIERILSMDGSNFQQLSKNWIEFKMQNLSKFIEQSEQNSREELSDLIEACQEVRSTKLTNDDDVELSTNVEKLLKFELEKQNKLKLEEEERLKALEAERLRELANAQTAMEVTAVSEDATTGKDITNQIEGAIDKTNEQVENPTGDVVCKLESIDKSLNTSQMESSGKENENPANDDKSTTDKENSKTVLFDFFKHLLNYWWAREENWTKFLFIKL